MTVGGWWKYELEVNVSINNFIISMAQYMEIIETMTDYFFLVEGIEKRVRDPRRQGSFFL